MPANPLPTILNIQERDKLDRIILAVSLHAPWSVPLFQSVLDGRINLIQPKRNGLLTKEILEKSSRPLIVLISDDDYQSIGPSGWSCAFSLKSWGQSAIIHAAAGEAKHYSYAVTIALMMKRLVLVETSTKFQMAWQSFLTPHMSTLTIQTKDNFQHPNMPQASEVL
jgi:hypothetical protein